MKNLIIINKSNCFKFAELIKYGQNVVKFDSDEVMEIVKKQTETINEMLKLNMFRLENLVDNVLVGSEYIAKEIPGYFTIIYANRDNKTYIPELSNDDLNILDLATTAAKNKIGVNININEKLYPKAKKIAKEKNIKFKIFENYQYFDGKQKSTSIYSQIEQALLDGIDSIIFSKSEVRVETVRVHSCSIGKFNHKKISVTVEEDNIVVTLNDNVKLLKRVSDVFDELVRCNKDYKNIWLGFLEELHPEVKVVANDLTEIKDDWSDIEEKIRLRDLQIELENNTDIDDDF